MLTSRQCVVLQPGAVTRPDGIQGGQCLLQAPVVVVVLGGDEQVHVLGRAYVAVGDDGEPADDHEASAGAQESAGDRVELRIWRRRAHRG